MTDNNFLKDFGNFDRNKKYFWKIFKIFIMTGKNFYYNSENFNEKIILIVIKFF